MEQDNIRLTNVVSDQARKINNILNDELITDGVKDLILAGKIKEAKTSENTTYLSAYASILDDLAEYSKAIDYYELAYETMLTVFGDDHPSTKTVKNNLDATVSANK